MKDSVLLIYIYICVLLALSVLIASMLILYPEAPAAGLYEDAFTRIADIFLYSLFSLLPLTSIGALLAVIFTVIKRGYSSLLDFLVFIFLCSVVWLLIIPFCFLYQPAEYVAFWFNKGASSPAARFFKSGFFSTRLQDYEALYFNPPALIKDTVSSLFFLSDVIRETVDKGRKAYLLLASVGFALASVYGFYSFSYWKLMNAVLVIVFWAGICILNIYMYSQSFRTYASSIWVPLIVNLTLGAILWVPAIRKAAVQAKRARED
ncbi:hypothetical protein V1L52_03535 [Treponema sp. HNW]|uniref:hypothetical protein n=1 Tax=Treponema sp. HNW TaxID=3116654 RepID=UPI003D132A08